VCASLRVCLCVGACVCVFVCVCGYALRNWLTLLHRSGRTTNKRGAIIFEEKYIWGGSAGEEEVEVGAPRIREGESELRLWY